MRFAWSSVSWSAVQAVMAPVAALALAGAAAPVPAPAPAEAPSPQAADDVVRGVELVAAAAAREERTRVAALERAAVALAHELRAVPLDASDRLCPRSELAVRWTIPTDFQQGAYLEPVGPAPTLATTEVNGVVVCGRSTWAFMGFEARRTGGAWDVTAVPYVEETHEHGHSVNLDADAGHDHHEEATAVPVANPSAPTAAVETAQWLAGLGPIEPYAGYEPQTSCSPTAKPGMVELRDALLGTHPVTRNLGIARACHIGGRSEHKEGRAFDWGAYVHRPVERAAVERFLTQLLATDADGNRHALARRLGVMYVIWDGRIWSAYRAADGWRTYRGPSPHTDHVHISLTWAGGNGRTSFFTQDLVERGVLGLVPPGGEPLPTGSLGPAPDVAPKPAPTPTATPTPKPSHDTDEPPAPAPKSREARPEPPSSEPSRERERDRERPEGPKADRSERGGPKEERDDGPKGGGGGGPGKGRGRS